MPNIKMYEYHLLKNHIKDLKEFQLEINYNELDKHFTAPKINKQYKRVPRKFKKKWKYILQGERYSHLSLGQKLWYIQYLENRNYNRFLIKQICENGKR